MTSTPIIGQLFKLPFTQPLTDGGQVLAATAAGNAFRVFYLTNSTMAAPVYQDAGLTTPYTTINNGAPYYNVVYANVYGQFPPIYLNPWYEYRSQLFDGNGRLLEDCDTVNNNNAGAPYVSGVALSAFKATTTARTSAQGALTPVDPDLSIYLPAAGTYKLDADLIFTVSTSTPLTIGFEPMPIGIGGQTPTDFSSEYPCFYFGTLDGAVVTGTPFLGIGGLSVPDAILTLAPGALSNVIHISATFQLVESTVPTDPFALFWGLNTSSVSLLAGSSMTILRVA
jgi:hypothetical protein